MWSPSTLLPSIARGDLSFASSSISRKDKTCRCDCKDDHDDVQLMAIEKIVKVPKIKIHDFGKKEDWDLMGKMNIDVTNNYKGMKYVMHTRTSPYESDSHAESGWEVAGKYDFENTNWEVDGKPGIDGFSFS